MTKEYLELLLKKHLEKTLIPQERLDLDNWYLHLAKSSLPLEDADLYKRLMMEMDKAFPFVTETPVKKIRLWPRIAAAAAILIIIGVSLWFFNMSRHPDTGQNPGNAMYANDIAPGTNKATLTLSNGKVIILSDTKTGVVIDASQLTYNDGTKISDPAINQPVLTSGQDHPELVPGSRTIQTPRGGIYQIILSDGTHVYLNAASSLKFPSSFASLKERKVELTGEAYFVVKHDSKQPFRVETKGQIVEDIGTEFNINAYTDEGNTKTTLIEGSARVLYTSRHSELVSEPRNRKATISDNGVVLTPGQQSILNHNKQIKVQQADLGQEIAWKNGDFVFKGETLESIMRKVARWYNVDVIYSSDAPKDLRLEGIVSRSRNISAILERMETTGSVKFKIDGRRVTVMR